MIEINLRLLANEAAYNCKSLLSTNSIYFTKRWNFQEEDNLNYLGTYRRDKSGEVLTYIPIPHGFLS